MPYGYHNFLFGWIDTPDQNFPAVADTNFLVVLLSIIEKLYAVPIKMVVSQALNKRLGTTDLTIAEMAEILENKKMTF